jgi:hypothetical protein
MAEQEGGDAPVDREPERLWTTEEAAVFLGISPTEVRRLAKGKILPCLVIVSRRLSAEEASQPRRGRPRKIDPWEAGGRIRLRFDPQRLRELANGGVLFIESVESAADPAGSSDEDTAEP